MLQMHDASNFYNSLYNQYEISLIQRTKTRCRLCLLKPLLTSAVVHLLFLTINGASELHPGSILFLVTGCISPYQDGALYSRRNGSCIGCHQILSWTIDPSTLAVLKGLDTIHWQSWPLCHLGPGCHPPLHVPHLSVNF